MKSIKKSSKRIYYVWLHNNTDSRDDEPLKVMAASTREARKIAESKLQNRFSIGSVFSAQEFRCFDPGWYSLVREDKALEK